MADEKSKGKKTISASLTPQLDEMEAGEVQATQLEMIARGPDGKTVTVAVPVALRSAMNTMLTSRTEARKADFAKITEAYGKTCCEAVRLAVKVLVHHAAIERTLSQANTPLEVDKAIHSATNEIESQLLRFLFDMSLPVGQRIAALPDEMKPEDYPHTALLRTAMKIAGDDLQLFLNLNGAIGAMVQASGQMAQMKAGTDGDAAPGPVLH